MTELAYLADLDSGYVARFRARVTALPPGGAVLDRTYFYPVGGGQPADRGTLGIGAAQWRVVDVARTGEAVLHRIGGGTKGLAVGAEVDGAIDWVRRHRHMRLHTGQHLLSALAFRHFGLRTRKAVLGGQSATIDLGSPLPGDASAVLFREMGRVVAEARPVRIAWIPRAAWDASGSAGRSSGLPLPAHVDPVRVVSISDEDECPCGGTHLRSTGEIGAVTPTPVGVGGPERLGFTLTEPGPTSPPA